MTKVQASTDQCSPRLLQHPGSSIGAYPWCILGALNNDEVRQCNVRSRGWLYRCPNTWATTHPKLGRLDMDPKRSQIHDPDTPAPTWRSPIGRLRRATIGTPARSDARTQRPPRRVLDSHVCACLPRAGCYIYPCRAPPCNLVSSTAADSESKRTRSGARGHIPQRKGAVRHEGVAY